MELSDNFVSIVPRLLNFLSYYTYCPMNGRNLVAGSFIDRERLRILVYISVFHENMTQHTKLRRSF